MKVDGFLEHQPITILIDTGSTNNFMDNKNLCASELALVLRTQTFVALCLRLIFDSALLGPLEPLHIDELAPALGNQASTSLCPSLILGSDPTPLAHPRQQPCTLASSFLTALFGPPQASARRPKPCTLA
ncbi:hypothetical protein BHE74_00057421 [Ensete ventricosum]|nr:hypothetical protein BHE74_00057421 [Ensete ventricosum]